jgi:hypothetical protein
VIDLPEKLGGGESMLQDAATNGEYSSCTYLANMFCYFACVGLRHPPLICP